MKIYNRENIITNEEIIKIFDLATFIAKPDRIYIVENKKDSLKSIFTIMGYPGFEWKGYFDFGSRDKCIGVNLFRLPKDLNEKVSIIVTSLLSNSICIQNDKIDIKESLVIIRGFIFDNFNTINKILKHKIDLETIAKII